MYASCKMSEAETRPRSRVSIRSSTILRSRSRYIANNEARASPFPARTASINLRKSSLSSVIEAAVEGMAKCD